MWYSQELSEHINKLMDDPDYYVNNI